MDLGIRPKPVITRNSAGFRALQHRCASCGACSAKRSGGGGRFGSVPNGGGMRDKRRRAPILLGVQGHGHGRIGRPMANWSPGSMGSLRRRRDMLPPQETRPDGRITAADDGPRSAATMARGFASLSRSTAATARPSPILPLNWASGGKEVPDLIIIAVEGRFG